MGEVVGQLSKTAANHLGLLESDKVVVVQGGPDAYVVCHPL